MSLIILKRFSYDVRFFFHLIIKGNRLWSNPSVAPCPYMNLEPYLLQSTIASKRWFAVCCMLVLLCMQAADHQEQLTIFQIPAGEAQTTLPMVAQQGQVDVMFVPEITEGVTTAAVNGYFLAYEVLNQMLEDTPLGVVRDSWSGAYAIVLATRPDDENEGRSTQKLQNPNTDNTDQETKMFTRNRRQTNPLRRLLLGALALTATQAATFAQEEQEDEDILLLSPFTIESTEDVGYLATSTLAGTRIRSNLEDISTSITVVTEELMNDTNSTDALDILVYTTGTEVAGVGGNFTNFATTGTSAQINDESTRNNILASTRIRGLASADRARDYFRSSIPFDSYNTTRIEINRGSNAVLFGLGSPAGIINNSLKQAIYKDATRVDFTFGSYGSYRASFDINRQIIDDVLAIRVMALHDDEKFEQDPAFQEDQRVHATFKFQKDLFGEDDNTWGLTTIRGSFEDGKQDANRPRTIPVTDLITPWFHPWDVDILGTLNLPAKLPWDSGNMGTRSWPRGAVTDPNDPYSTNARLTHHVVDSYHRGVSMIFEGPGNIIPSDPYGDGTVLPRIIGRQGISNNVVENSTGVFMQATNLNTALRDYRSPTGGTLPYAAFYSSPTLSDRSIFDFRKLLIDGPNKYENFEFDAKNIFIEQLLFDDKVGFEIAYASETIEQEYGGRFNAGARTGLSIDINTTLMDGTPNKNFGRPFVSGSGYYGGSKEEREDFRATIFAEIDFTENDNKIIRWLGKHTITGLFSDSQEDRIGFSGVPVVTGLDNLWNRNTSLTSTQGRRVGSVHYLGPSIADRNTPAGANISNIRVAQMPNNEIAGDGFYRLAGNSGRSPLPQGQFQNVQLALTENAINSATRTSRNVESLAFVLQSSLIKDVLITTVSWRQDDLVSKARGAPERDDNGFIITDFPLIDDDPLLSKDSTWNYGFVLKTPNSWLEKVKGLSTLNVHYGESENFQPARSRFNPDGSLISSPTGETTDYGFTVGLFDNKFIVRTTWYETTQSNVGASDVPSLNTFAGIHGRVLEFTDQPGAERNPDFNANLDDDIFPEIDTNGDGIADIQYVPPPQDYLDRVGFTYDPVEGAQLTGGIPASAVQDLETKGVEIELVYNPTPNWNILFNAYRQEAISNNAAATFREFVNTPAYDFDGDGTLETNWEQAFLGNLRDFISSTSRNTVQLDAQNFFNRLRRVEALDGQKNPELREWRFNVITNYRFTDGTLEGVNVGGAIRWEDESIIGFALREFEDGAFNIDVDRPFFGDSEIRVDAWVGYTRKIWNDRIDWKIQLNVRNLLNDDELVPIKANPDGAEVAWRIPTPLEWTIRNTFSF